MSSARTSLALSVTLATVLLVIFSACSTADSFDYRFQQSLDRHGIAYQVPRTEKAILVNVPAFELIAFENGRPVIRSRVIVGTPENPTPLVKTETSVVRFRPTWRPTPAMVASGEYEDWLRPSGTKNPLGLAAIRLGGDLLVYLHDTNQRDLFARSDRALSHGCIRVEKWDQVISWLLDMPLKEVHRLASGRHTMDVEAPAVPVNLGYLRAFVDEDGQLQRYPDVYQRETVVGGLGSEKRSATC